MGFKININYKNIKVVMVKTGSERLETFASVVVKGVKSRTPEDKLKLVRSIGKTSQIFTGTKILQQVKSLDNVEYLAPVEYGVQGNTYNYHKPKGSVFMRGVGAGMFRRTHFDLKDNFNEYE